MEAQNSVITAPTTPTPITFADLARAAEENPMEWLVPSTIIAGGMHLIYGKEESYKTTLVMQMLGTLNLGGHFVNWDIPGGFRVGFVELEMSELIWRHRVKDFCKPAHEKPVIHVPNPAERRAILDAPTTKQKVHAVLTWASNLNLDVIGIDSVTKLFPPDANTGSAPVVSDLFSQFQKSGRTIILIAHPRKTNPQFGDYGNDAIAGSGRFAQEPDIVLSVTREDKRAPKVTLSWGKNRMAGKPEDVELYFDRKDFRLYRTRKAAENSRQINGESVRVRVVVCRRIRHGQNKSCAGNRRRARRRGSSYRLAAMQPCHTRNGSAAV